MLQRTCQSTWAWVNGLDINPYPHIWPPNLQGMLGDG